MEYNQKIVECKHTFKEGPNFGDFTKNPVHISIFAGMHCEFCGHLIAWIWTLVDESGKSWAVGSDCVFNLLKLDESKKRAYKSIIAKAQRLDRCQRKYGKIVEFLIKNEPGISSFSKMQEEGKARVAPNAYATRTNGKPYVSVVVGENCFAVSEDSMKKPVCPIHSASYIQPYNCRTCASLTIIEKVEEIGTLNEFWLDNYEKLTGNKIKELIQK